MAGWLTGRVPDWLVGWLVGRLAGRLAGWLTGRLSGWLTVIDWLAGCLASLLAGWLTSCLVSRLANWLACWISQEAAGVCPGSRLSAGATDVVLLPHGGPPPHTTSGLGILSISLSIELIT